MKKDILALIIVIFIGVLLFKGTKIQSVEDYYLTHIDDITSDSQTVFITIECKTILDNWESLDDNLKYEEYVPSSGIILDRYELVLRDGDTVYDILNRVTKYNKIQMESTFTKAFNSYYVEGINHLYEYSCGALSGWMFKVNGEFPNYGSNLYKLQDKDEIVWAYTCDLGRDLGASFDGE